MAARPLCLDGVHDPCRPNDRLPLSMKGGSSERELGVIRARMLDAVRAKARRGERRISVPIACVRRRDAGRGFDPDMRLPEVIRLTFARFRQRPIGEVGWSPCRPGQFADQKARSPVNNVA